MGCAYAREEEEAVVSNFVTVRRALPQRCQPAQGFGRLASQSVSQSDMRNHSELTLFYFSHNLYYI